MTQAQSLGGSHGQSQPPQHQSQLPKLQITISLSGQKDSYAGWSISLVSLRVSDLLAQPDLCLALFPTFCPFNPSYSLHPLHVISVLSFSQCTPSRLAFRYDPLPTASSIRLLKFHAGGGNRTEANCQTLIGGRCG